MCDSTKSNSHSHGVRSDVEKALGDLREDLSEKLRLITRHEAHIKMIGAADFPQVGAVIHVLEKIRDEEKGHVADLMTVINMLDGAQASRFNNHPDHQHSHERR